MLHTDSRLGAAGIVRLDLLHLANSGPSAAIDDPHRYLCAPDAPSSSTMRYQSRRGATFPPIDAVEVDVPIIGPANCHRLTAPIGEHFWQCFGHMSGLLVRAYDRWVLMKSDCPVFYHGGELCGS
jgi:hypothetical protein